MATCLCYGGRAPRGQRSDSHLMPRDSGGSEPASRPRHIAEPGCCIDDEAPGRLLAAGLPSQPTQMSELPGP